MGETVDWKKRAIDAEAETARLRGELAQLRDVPRGGRPPTKARSADGMLIAQVCDRMGWTRGQLAERLEVDQAVLSRVNTIPLAQHHRDACRALLGLLPEDPAPVAPKPTRRARS